MICRCRNTIRNAFLLLLLHCFNIAISVILSTSTALAEESDPAVIAPPEMSSELPDQAPPPELKKPPTRRELVSNQALADSFAAHNPDNTDVVWLDQGKERYLGLFVTDYSGRTIGNILILHDNQQHPDWPGIVHTLRTNLPSVGWSTFSISMPYFDVTPDLPPRDPVPPPSTQAAETESAAENSTEKPLDNKTPNTMETASQAVEERQHADAEKAEEMSVNIEYSREQVPEVVGQRIQQAIISIQSRNRRPIILVTAGLSARWAAFTLKTLPKDNIRGLVMIDADETTLLDDYFLPKDSSLTKDSTSLRIPVLDIAPLTAQRSPSDQRLRMAIQNRNATFEQKIIRSSSQTLSQHSHQIMTSIRGWAKRHFQR